MKRLLIAVALLFCISTCMKAQYVRPDNQVAGQPAPTQKQYNFWDHTSLGGNLSLQFGTVTYIVLAPLLNYHINDNFVIGVGPYYQYFSFNEYPSFSTSVYGGRMVAMAFLPGHLSKLFVQGEYDFLDVPDYFAITSNDKRVIVGIPLVGAGYRQPAGDKCYFTLAILFDLSNSPLSPYFVSPNSYTPIIFAGIDVGL